MLGGCISVKRAIFRFSVVVTYLEISIGNSMICSDIWHKYHS